MPLGLVEQRARISLRGWAGIRGEFRVQKTILFHEKLMWCRGRACPGHPDYSRAVLNSRGRRDKPGDYN
jgi:hypothetical protein